MHSPLSSFHYSETPERHEARWQSQLQFWQRAHNAFLALRQLADGIGDHWERDVSALAGTDSAPPLAAAPADQPVPSGRPPSSLTSGKSMARRRSPSVDDLVRFRLALLDTAYARLLLMGHVWARLDATLGRTRGRCLPQAYIGGPALPRTFGIACAWLQDALNRLREFVEVAPDFPWLRCGDQVWTLRGSRPDLDGWLKTVTSLDVDACETTVLGPFRVCSEAASAQIEGFAVRYEQAKTECIAASNRPAETILRLNAALTELRSLEDCGASTPKSPGTLRRHCLS
jgi:hypothetical protein